MASLVFTHPPDTSYFRYRDGSKFPNMYFDQHETLSEIAIISYGCFPKLGAPQAMAFLAENSLTLVTLVVCTHVHVSIYYKNGHNNT